MSESAVSRFDPASVTRPDPALLTYYIIVAIFTVFGFPFVFPILYFKFRTLKFKFDDKGVSMAWGILNHREIYLTYRRIQDIHVTRNLMHRWLGLASVSVQTASGSSGAEMTIEGIRDPEALRDFLYAQMRGAKGEGDDAVTASPAAQSDQAQPEDEALQLLREIRDELRARHNVAGQGA